MKRVDFAANALFKVMATFAVHPGHVYATALKVSHNSASFIVVLKGNSFHCYGMWLT